MGTGTCLHIVQDYRDALYKSEKHPGQVGVVRSAGTRNECEGRCHCGLDDRHDSHEIQPI